MKVKTFFGRSKQKRDFFVQSGLCAKVLPLCSQVDGIERLAKTSVACNGLIVSRV